MLQIMNEKRNLLPSKFSFNPLSIISQKKVDQLLGRTEGIHLGNPLTPPLELFVEFMKVWVDEIDARLSFVERYTPAYFLLFTNRGFTYDEYKILFKEIPEENYKHYPIFEFLRIPSKLALIEHRLGMEENLESYFQILDKAFHDTNRTGVDFFLKSLRTKLPMQELQRHCYISGSTGSGKSELMRLLFYHLQQSSEYKKTRTLILIDAHGDLAEQVKTSHLNKNSKRLIYVEPDLRKGWSPVINPLEMSKKDDSSIVARAQFLADAIEEAIKVDMSVNMNALLIPALSLLLRLEDTTLLDLVRLMKDDKELIAKGKSVGIRSHREFFQNFHDSHYKKTKTAIYTKLQAFLNYPAFYNMVIGKSTIDVGKAINSGKVLIFNLSQRHFGSDASKAFGRFVISLIKSHVITRAQYRKPTYLFIDECQNFVSPSIQSILEEARKYGLHLVMANQSIERLGNIESVVLANTAVKLVGKNDSIQTVKKMSSITGTPTSIFHNILNYHFYLKTSSSKGEIFKASDALILDKRMAMSETDKQQMNRYLIDQYYRKVEDEMSDLDQKEHAPKFEL